MTAIRERVKIHDALTTVEGASRLASQVQGYWSRQGFTVKTFIQTDNMAQSLEASKKRLYSLRSDLKNGLPANAK